MSQKKLLMLTFRLNEAAAGSWNKVVCFGSQDLQAVAPVKKLSRPAFQQLVRLWEWDGWMELLPESWERYRVFLVCAG